LQGERHAQTADAIRAGDLDRAAITPAERRLLDFVGTLTRHAYQITDEHVQGLRDVGWSDEQIAETVYIGALFNLFVRIADAFGIDPPAEYEPGGVPEVIRREVES
jgi:alkylhydroperoxidase family enzyme